MEVERLKKEGLLTITTSVVLIVVALILSSGYYAQAGLLWNLNNSMYLLKIAVGCEEQLAWPNLPSCEDGFTMTIHTKYAISALALLLIYGVGQFLEFFPSLRFWNKNQQAD